MTTVGYSLKVRVLELLYMVSGSSNSSSKALVIYVVLPITVMWRGVYKFTLETPFFHLAGKKKIKFVNIDIDINNY